MKGDAIAIVTAIESGSCSVQAIHAATAIPIATIYARVADLRRIGAIRSYRHALGRFRRPCKHYAEKHERRYALRTAQ